MRLLLFLQISYAISAAFVNTSESDGDLMRQYPQFELRNAEIEKFAKCNDFG
jgi:hypothetical protein